MTQTRGQLITFEGPEACGKTTQVGRLASVLQEQGLRVLVVREPGGTELGERIRTLLKEEHFGYPMSAQAEFLLFAASRAQLVREKMQPALEAGTWVLCDRFLDSSWVYQGMARGMPLDVITTINAFAIGACMPDLTLFLDLPWEVSEQRLQRRRHSDRLEQEPAAFHKAVLAGYRRLAQEKPERVVSLDAQKTPEALQSEIRHVISDRYSSLSLASQP